MSFFNELILVAEVQVPVQHQRNGVGVVIEAVADEQRLTFAEGEFSKSGSSKQSERDSGGQGHQAFLR